MAVPAYTTDLVRIVDFDADTPTVAETLTWAAGRSPAIDTDFPIQGTNHGSATMNTTGKASMVATGTAFTWSTGIYIFGWVIWLAPGAIATQANGGLAMIIGSSASVYKIYYVGGNDFGSYPYGGWQNFVVDPNFTADETSGTPTAYHVVGSGANVLSAVSKGNPLGMDVFRYGRGQIRVAGGQSGNYATFTGIAAVNDANTARWGLFQKIDGGFKFKGLMYLGYGALTEFTDLNKSIVIDNTEFVSSDFNRIEIHNASSIINWTNISISALGTTSRGQLEMIDNATFNDIGGVFTGMDTFIYQSNADLDGRIFRSCNQVTQGGCTMDSCTFETSTATYALNADVPNNITNCIFKGNSTALYIPASVTGTITLSGDVFTGNTTDIYWAGTSGTLIVNSPSASTWSSAGGTVDIQNAVVLTISANVSLVGAEVRIYDYNSTGGNLGTELDGVESNPSANFVYGGAGGNLIWIQVMLPNYVEYGAEFTMPSADGTTKINLEQDLND
jgi:hypothetical protein